MNSLMGKSFKSSQCKTHLRLATARIKLLRNKRDSQIKVLKKEIAGLLQSGQESGASIQVEHVIREQNIIEAYDTIEIFAELVAIRLPIIDSQKNCPLDLKEAISSLIFASPRCVDLPELAQIRTLFQSKYGKDFIAIALELRPDCGVNRRVIEKLSIRNPTMETKFKLMKEIAAEHNVEWDTSAFEKEVVKVHEDLLDGPCHSAHEMPVLSRTKEELPKPITQASSVNSTFLPDNLVPYVHVQRPPLGKNKEAKPDVKDQPSSMESFNTIVQDTRPNNESPSRPQSDMFLPQVSLSKNEDARRHSLGFAQDESRREDGSVSQATQSRDQVRDSRHASIGVQGEKALQDRHQDADSVAKATTIDNHRAVATVSVAMSLAHTNKYLQSSDSGKQSTRSTPPQIALGGETNDHDGYSRHENQEHQISEEESVQPMRNRVSREINFDMRNSKSQAGSKMRSDLHRSPQFDDDDLNRGPCGVLDNKTSSHDFKEEIGKPSYKISKLGKNSEPLVHDPFKSNKSKCHNLDIYETVELHELDNFLDDEHISWKNGAGRTISKPSLDGYVTSTSHGNHDFEEAISSKGSWGSGSDKVRFKDDVYQHNDSHIPHEFVSMETLVMEGSHSLTRRGKSTKLLVGESHSSMVAKSLGFDEDRDRVPDEEPHEGGTPKIKSKSSHDKYGEHDLAPLWDGEPHGRATTKLNFMSSHGDYDEEVRGSPTDHHGSASRGSLEDEHPATFKHGGRGHKDEDRRVPRAQFERYRKHDDPSHGSEDDAIIPTRKGPSLRKSKVVDSDPNSDAYISHEPSYDQDKMPTLHEVDSLSGTIGRRRESWADNSWNTDSHKTPHLEEYPLSPFANKGSRKDVGRTKISHLEKMPTSHDTPLFDEQEDDIGALLHVGKGRIAKPTFNEFYEGESTRYVDDPCMKGIRLGRMDSDHLKPPRTPKYHDEGDDFERSTFNSSYRTKQEQDLKKDNLYSPHFSRDAFDSGESAFRKRMSLPGDLPYEKAKHESSRARDTTSGYVERHTGRRLTVGGDELCVDIRGDGNSYVGKTIVNVSRVVGDSKQFKDVKQSQGRKNFEGNRLPNSRSKARDNHLDHKMDYQSKETSTRTNRQLESPQGTSTSPLEYKDNNSYVEKSRVDVSRVVDDSQQFDDVEQSQGRKKSEGNRLSNARPKARDTHLEQHKMDYRSTETSTSPFKYEDHNSKLASNLPKLNVRKQGNLQDVAYQEDIHTPISRTSRPSRADKPLKVNSSSSIHEPVQRTPRVILNVPLPKASSDSLGQQKVFVLQDPRRTQSATKDNVLDTPSKAIPKLIKPPDLNDFLAKFNKR